MATATNSAEKVTVLVTYMPVVHRGYAQFIQAHPEAAEVVILAKEVLEQFAWLRKDLRALEPEEIVESLKALKKKNGWVLDITLGTEAALRRLASAPSSPTDSTLQIIFPDEEITREIAAKYFADNSQIEVVFESVFLRWDRQQILAEQPISANNKISLTNFQQKFLKQAEDLAQKSGDWWRQVGTVVAKDGEVLFSTFNQHVPDQYQTAYNGDPRASFSKGQHIELTTAMHAEAAAVAAAAKHGTSLEGAEIYVTTFPCPNCAKLIAYSGIKKLYYQEGYSMVDGESILKENDVEIIEVSPTSQA
jgi:dCMP deaminase